MVGEAFERYLAAEPGIEVVALAGTVDRAVAAAMSFKPDVVVVDGRLADGTGADLARHLQHHHLDVHVVWLTERADRVSLQAAIDAGCAGLLETSDHLERLSAAVRDAAAGRLAVSLDSVQQLLGPVAEAPAASTGITARELEVLRLVALGRSNQQIAAELGLRLNTVRTHIQNTFTKLGAHSKVEAVARSRQLGLLEG